jgi:hypothetical protein
MIDAIITSFEVIIGILDNPKILLLLIPICIIGYLYLMFS